MTEKQKRFVDEYLIDLNATQAAVRAGYSAKSAYSIGTENLKKPEIKRAIEEQLQQIHNARTADAQEIIEYLTSVMRGESTAQVVVVEGEGEGCSTARTMEKAPDEKERLRAAELLGKRFGIFTDKAEINANITSEKLADVFKQIGGEGLAE